VDLNHPTRRPVIPNLPFPVRHEVELALTAEIQWLCGTGKIEEVYRAWPCPNGRASAIHKLIADRLASRFEGEETQLVVFPGEAMCGFWFQACEVQGQAEYPAFDEIPVAARRNLESVGAL
jgi:hypothetical protein